MLGIALVALAPPVWGATGNGALSVSNDGLCEGDGYTGSTTPTHFNVLEGHTIHLNIAASGMICTSGANLNDSCTSAANCSGKAACSGSAGAKTCEAGDRVGLSCTNTNDCPITGTCASALECSGETNVYIKGTDNTPCTDNSQCTAAVETDCDTEVGFCKFIDAVAVTVGAVTANQIDVCYEVPDNMCQTSVVAYCGDAPGEYIANATIPKGTQTNAAAGIRPVVEGTGTCGNGDPCTADTTCSGIGNGMCHYDEIACVAPDTGADCNTGELCCGLTQGAYGAPRGIANGAGNGNCANPQNMGYITLAKCNAGTDPFGGGVAPNETTIGQFGTKSVTLLDQSTLIAYLPAGGTASSLTAGTGDKQYSGGTITPPAGNASGAGSKGNGAGVLAAQTMAGQLNAFLSDSGFAPGGFSEFTVPGALLCTRRSGADKTVDTADDVCQAFSYPKCATGLTVSELVQCSNQVLASVSASCTCNAKDLNAALDNINNQFDQCGHAIDCGSVTKAGEFTCPTL
jgi:hypothetical protein